MATSEHTFKLAQLFASHFQESFVLRLCCLIRNVQISQYNDRSLVFYCLNIFSYDQLFLRLLLIVVVVVFVFVSYKRKDAIGKHVGHHQCGNAFIIAGNARSEFYWNEL